MYWFLQIQFKYCRLTIRLIPPIMRTALKTSRIVFQLWEILPRPLSFLQWNPYLIARKGLAFVMESLSITSERGILWKLWQRPFRPPVSCPRQNWHRKRRSWNGNGLPFLHKELAGLFAAYTRCRLLCHLPLRPPCTACKSPSGTTTP